MFIPIHDDNPLENIKFQFVTVGLIITNAVIFVFFQTDLIAPPNIQATTSFAVVPIELLSEGLFGVNVTDGKYDVIPIAERWTLISYMFLHGNWLHLIGNMLFLWVFGDNVEDALGHTRFLVFYLLCGVFAALAHSWLLPTSPLPLIGASGAIAGVVAAYLMLHPRVRVWVLVFFRIPVPINAGFVLGFWVLLQIFNAFTAAGDNVAWWAHVGGLTAGAFLVLFMRRSGVSLFDRTPSQAA